MRRLLIAAIVLAAAGCREETTRPPTQLLIGNPGPYTVDRVHIASCGSGVLGPNRLAGATIAPAAARAFRVEAGCWDVTVGTTSHASTIPYPDNQVAEGETVTVDIGALPPPPP